MRFEQDQNIGKREKERFRPLAFIHVLGINWERRLDGVLSEIPELGYSDIPRKEKDFYRATLTSCILTDVVAVLDKGDRNGLVHFFTELTERIEDERLEIRDTLCDEEGNLPSIIRKRADSIRRFIREKGVEESLSSDVMELPDIQGFPDIKEEAGTIRESIGEERGKVEEEDVLPEGEEETREKESPKETRELQPPEVPPLLERWYRDARPRDRLSLLANIRYNPGFRKDSYLLVSVNGIGKLVKVEEVLDFLKKVVPSTEP